jgi:hypothetical protein
VEAFAWSNDPVEQLRQELGIREELARIAEQKARLAPVVPSGTLDGARALYGDGPRPDMGLVTLLTDEQRAELARDAEDDGPEPYALTDRHAAALELAIRAKGYEIHIDTDTGDVKLIHGIDASDDKMAEFDVTIREVGGHVTTKIIEADYFTVGFSGSLEFWRVDNQRKAMTFAASAGSWFFCKEQGIDAK